MDDSSIVTLFWSRDQRAIDETEKKYGRYLHKISYNILCDRSDCDEAVNDTYLKAWNSIPPQCPAVLRSYLARLVRAVSIDIFRKKNSEKRKPTEYLLSLQELEDCVSDHETPEDAADAALLTALIEKYLTTLSLRDRNAFVMRYFFFDSVADIASHSGMTRPAVKSLLYRTRCGLKAYLEKEGFTL
ncbi:MAG: sigma-70 family RNA polymerase sigma factor [Oscillospiraceae bacterium]|nr:sigma-70 family RNA polymerase sigma factor [Oscillospiraceae bacterium]